MDIYPIDTIAKALNMNPLGFIIDDSRPEDSVYSKGSVGGELHPFYGQTITEEHKQIIRDHQTGRVVSDITRKRLSVANTGLKRSEETKKRNSEASKGEKNGFFGKTHTEEIRKKISEANKGRMPTDNTRKLASERWTGDKHPNWGGKQSRGRIHSEATKQKQKESALDRPKLICPHCSKESAINMAHRWHFDNCKLKPI